MSGSGRRPLWKIAGAGILFCLVLALILSFMVNPSTVWVNSADGHSHSPRPVSLTLQEYGVNVVGFTVWFTVLGVLATGMMVLLLYLLRFLKKEGQ